MQRTYISGTIKGLSGIYYRMQKHHGQKGFTLLELIVVVVAVIILLVVIVSLQ